MDAELTQKSCLPCSGATPPLGTADIQELLKLLDGWRVVDGKELAKSYAFKNFVEAVQFVNAITPVAEREGHHPDLLVGWGTVRVMLRTHAIDALSENDFILAAKIDQLFQA
ncbi:MAG: 4a-hydroxytetrahydrobiopterin dehydratase [Chloroflexota bacterium]